MNIEFKLLNIKIYVNFYFIAFLSMIAVLGNSLSLSMSILASLMHELGHIIMMIILDRRSICRIKIDFFNIDIVDRSRRTLSMQKNILVLISGSLVNFLIAILFDSLYLIFKAYFLIIFSYINICIGVLNLLPISILDGGQILLLILNKNISIKNSVLISQIISILFLVPISFLGFIILLDSKYNFSLLILSCYLIMYMVFREDMCF